MANGLENLITRTRLLAGLSKTREMNDRQLLEQFADGDETAFSALVDRYGGLVMGVCQRVLQHTQDAEDAFQATFMVLARKADQVAWKDTVANWLHGAACRVSFQIRRERLRRQVLAGRASDERYHSSLARPANDPSWSDVQPMLDEELDRLPAIYRQPLILCCLEGKTRDEAAAQLGWSVGSVKGRLERGREILRSRLAKRGFALSAVLAATLLTGGSVKAAVPLTLGLETVRAGMAMATGQAAGLVSSQVLTLAQGAFHAMYMTKLKFAAAVLMAVLTLGLGTGYVTHQVLAGNRPAGDSSQSYKTLFAEEFPGFVLQREGERGQERIFGVVQSIDAAKNTISVQVLRREADGQTYQLAKDVKVVIREGRDSKPSKLADVKEKARVSLLLDETKKIVQTIELLVPTANPGGERGRPDGLTHSGVLTEVDAAKRTITLQTGGRGTDVKSTTYELAKDSKVLFRTGRAVKEGKLADLELKKTVLIRMDEAKKTVQTIEVSISTMATGTVTEVDAAKNTITIGIGGKRDGTEGTSETYSLAKDVKVFYRVPTTKAERGNPEASSLTLADVPAKVNVSLQLDDQRKIVQSIDIALVTVTGTVQAVDSKKLTLAIRMPRQDADMNLGVAKDAQIKINGNDGKLDAVTVGAEVQMVLSPDRTKVLVLRTPVPEGRRE